MPLDTSKTGPTPNVVASGAPERQLHAELAPVFDAAFKNFSHVVLAVSGGSDSTALMHLAAAWRQSRLRHNFESSSTSEPPTLSVLTIDHGLRGGSAAEAEAVARAAESLGLSHTTLRWDGPKPATGLQAAARAARHALIAAHLAANDRPAVALAHTADDQAETLLMRLARGSGIDGLGAMRPATSLDNGVTLLRPLLAMSKTALSDFLRHSGIAWCEDPSNQREVFERVRWRRLQVQALDAGIALDSRALARSARRAARACEALAALTQRAWRESDGRAAFGPLGSATIEWPWLIEQPEEIRLRLLAGLMHAIGGQDKPVSLGSLEAFATADAWERPPSGTLHGVLFEGQADKASAQRLVLMREWGRQGPARMTMQPGENLLWDRRFDIASEVGSAEALEVGPLGPEGLAELERLTAARPSGDARLLATQPALRRAGRLVAVPTLGFRAADFRARVDCRLRGPRFGSQGCELD